MFFVHLTEIRSQAVRQRLIPFEEEGVDLSAQDQNRREVEEEQQQNHRESDLT